MSDEVGFKAKCLKQDWVGHFTMTMGTTHSGDGMALNAHAPNRTESYSQSREAGQEPVHG